ncbi:MAG: hypothetical protein M3314_15835 [Actinomycetota bacterium]|nr:hypothetical protein [Actinomycetota bacterium]
MEPAEVGAPHVVTLVGRPERPGVDAEVTVQHAEGVMKRAPRSGEQIGDTDLDRLGARIAELKARYLPEPPAPKGTVNEGRPEREPVERPAHRDGTNLLVLFLVTRVVLIAIGLVSRELMPGPVAHPRPLGVGPSFSSIPFLDLWGQWDSSWYLSIAKYGYRPEPLEGALANYAFFPLYPLLARGVGWMVGNPYIGGLIVSNAAFIVACVFLHRLVALDDDVETARRTVKYLFAAPAAFLFSAMLSESLYLALVVMCFYFARTDRWWAVGLLGFLLALTRGPGFLVVVPLLWVYLEQRGFSLRRLHPDVLWLALLPAGVGTFMLFNWDLTGNPLAFARIQLTGWGHQFQNPLSALWGAVTGGDTVLSFNGWYMIGMLVLTLVSLRMLGMAYALFALISILMPLLYSAPGGSMVRYALVIFPLYIVAARFTRDRPALDQAVTIALALLQGFLMSHWVHNSLLVV